ncbi:DUF1573 domain-containing protein [Flavihumibacter stibioxidans]|uniref:DUF1573 domain-containing protein n=1 Tax=Flavihumibacter stibioxidans TaxID=1834163 RepID=A0ABR7MBS6_9BACT|nr:DUF1573 domain-containing protein [Flavihumibacter stibioxidans]MBC6492481.1 hypothetical protein [Flavihumibacter stibioxidans]
MKKIALTLFAVVISAAIFAQAKKADELVKFAELKHNFGKIKQGTPVTHVFEFTNISGKPLVIENASASCGCTTPTWPQQPVAQGKGNKITAGFNAAAPGPFDKTVFVKVSGADQPLELRISGEVLTAEQYASYESTKGKKSGK